MRFLLLCVIYLLFPSISSIDLFYAFKSLRGTNPASDHSCDETGSGASYFYLNSNDISLREGARYHHLPSTNGIFISGGFSYDYLTNPGTLNDVWYYSVDLNWFRFVRGSLDSWNVPSIGNSSTYDSENNIGGRGKHLSTRMSESEILIGFGYGIDHNDVNGFLNDLWAFDFTSDRFKKINGKNYVGQVGTYYGTFRSDNVISGRAGGDMVKIGEDLVAIFGGYGLCVSEGEYGRLNDVHLYDFTSNSYRFERGDLVLNAKGVFGQKNSEYGDPTVQPGASYPRGISLFLPNSNEVLIMCGQAFDSENVLGYMNDVWKYNISSRLYRWIHGSNYSSAHGTFGLEYNSINLISGRAATIGWLFNDHEILIYGGKGYDLINQDTYLGDLWSYDITLNEFKFVGGNPIGNTSATYGIEFNFDNTGPPLQWAAGVQINEREIIMISGMGYCYNSEQTEAMYLSPVFQIRKVAICWSVAEFEEHVCSGRGDCIDDNLCKCESGYTGSNCSLLCPTGKYCLNGVENNCTDGTWSHFQSTTPENCTCCSIGGQKVNSDRSGCEFCPDGWIMPNVCGKDCVICENGKFAASNQSKCLHCSLPGMWSPLASSSENNCTCCEAGSMLNNISRVGCILCPLGYRSNGSCPTECLQCEDGEFSNLDSCDLCPSGSYCQAGIKQNCVEPGMWSPPASSSENNCTCCEAGSRVNTITRAGCISCPLGHHSNGSCATECDLCSPGSYCQAGVEQNCTEVGMWSLSGSSNISDCHCCLDGWMRNSSKNGCEKCQSGYQSKGFCATECEFFDCFGILSYSQTPFPCNGNGNCVGTDNCNCSIGAVDPFCFPVYEPPVVDLSIPKLIGRCASLTMDASSSLGYDLSFIWSSLTSTNLEFLNDFAVQSFDSDVFGDEDFGVLQFSVTVVDHWERYSELKFDVERVNTGVPTATIIGSKERYVYVSDGLSIHGKGTTECSSGSTTEFQYRWEQVSGNSLNFEGVNLEKSVLEYPEFPFRSDSYEFKFTVFNVFGNNSDNVLVHTLIRDLVARVNDSSKTIPINRTVYLSGSVSIDPESSSGIETWNWECVNPSNDPCTSEEMVSIFSSAKFTPSSEGVYKLLLYYYRDTRSSNTSVEYEVFYVEDDVYVPNIWITYEAPIVGPYCITSQRVPLNGFIEDHEFSPEVDFLWSCDTIRNLEEVVLSDIRSLNLIIEPNVIVQNTKCYLQASHGNVSVKATIELLLNTPPMYGSVTVHPMEGFVLQDFSIYFSNWVDFDQPLQYSVEYLHFITNRTKLVIPFTTQEMIPFKISTQGCLQFDYNIELIVKIVDSWQSMTIETIPIKVRPITGGTNSMRELLVTTTMMLENCVEVNVFDEGSITRMLTVLNTMINKNCSELSFQEQLCMTYEECEQTNLLSEYREEFFDFLDSSLDFLMYFVDSLEEYQLNSIVVNLEMIVSLFRGDEEALIEKTYNFCVDFLERFDVELDLSDYFLFLNATELFLPFSSNEEDSIFSFLTGMFTSFIQKLSVGEKNVYLHETSNINFDYTRDYTPNYLENLKLRIFEKVLVINETLTVEIPGEIVSSLGLSIVVSTFTYVISPFNNENSSSVALYFMEEGRLIDMVVVDPIIIRFHNVRAFRTTEYDFQCLYGIGSEIECDGIYNQSESLIVCSCVRMNGIYSFRIFENFDDTFTDTEGSLEGMTQITILLITFGCVLGLLVTACVLLSVVLALVFVVYINRRRSTKKHKIIPSTKGGKDVEMQENAPNADSDSSNGSQYSSSSEEEDEEEEAETKKVEKTRVLQKKESIIKKKESAAKLEKEMIKDEKVAIDNWSILKVISSANLSPEKEEKVEKALSPSSSSSNVKEEDEREQLVPKTEKVVELPEKKIIIKEETVKVDSMSGKDDALLSEEEKKKISDKNRLLQKKESMRMKREKLAKLEKEMIKDEKVALGNWSILKVKSFTRLSERGKMQEREEETAKKGVKKKGSGSKISKKQGVKKKDEKKKKTKKGTLKKIKKYKHENAWK